MKFFYNWSYIDKDLGRTNGGVFAKSEREAKEKVMRTLKLDQLNGEMIITEETK